MLGEEKREERSKNLITIHNYPLDSLQIIVIIILFFIDFSFLDFNV